jgi:hypothetical protein
MLLQIQKKQLEFVLILIWHEGCNMGKRHNKLPAIA